MVDVAAPTVPRGIDVLAETEATKKWFASASPKVHDCRRQVDVPRKQVLAAVTFSGVREEALTAAQRTQVGEISQAAQIADAMVSLIHTYQNLKSRLANSLDPEVASLFLLVRLVKGGPKRAKELADQMCADQSTVSRQVAGLVKSGLVERQADPYDGRASILVPTASGIDRVRDHVANRGQ